MHRGPPNVNWVLAAQNSKCKQNTCIEDYHRMDSVDRIYYDRGRYCVVESDQYRWTLFPIGTRNQVTQRMENPRENSASEIRLHEPESNRLLFIHPVAPSLHH